MRQSKFTESQIRSALKEVDAGVAVALIARKQDISAATFYQWRAKFGRVEVSDMKRLRDLEQERMPAQAPVRRPEPGSLAAQGAELIQAKEL